MTEDGGWFRGIDPTDVEAAAAAVRDGTASESRDWPAIAVEEGVTASTEEYYRALHEATVHAARESASAREQADDRQLAQAVRALDDCRRVRNELTERVASWAGTLDGDASVSSEYLQELAAREPSDAVEERVIGLAERTEALETEERELESFIERTAPDVAPNLSALAGAELAARLLSLAGDLETLAKKPAGTVQVLGAEDALFAHLRGGAPSPKHGIIYTHDYVRGTDPEHRGTAARALAGKLTIAARIDHYSGEYRPELEAELDERIERIRARESA